MVYLSKPTITILNKRDAKLYKPSKSLWKKPILIRILDGSPFKEEQPVRHHKRYKHELDMAFLDIEIEQNESLSSIKERQNIYQSKLFNENHIKQLYQFLKPIDFNRVSEIVIHCTEGERRSVSIALIIAKHFTYDLDAFNTIQSKKRFTFGNPYVYGISDNWMNKIEHRQ